MKHKWIFTLFNTLAVVLILASVFVLLTVVMTPAGQVPQVLGFSVLRVMTGSMEPAIPENTMLLVRQTDPEEIAVGDVITFFSPDPALDGASVTHRVQSVDRQAGTIWFTTKGDANAVVDSDPVPAERLVGKVVFTSAGLGAVIGFLSNPLVFGMFILLPLLGVLVSHLCRAIRLSVKLAREEEEAAVRQALDAIANRKAEEDTKQD